MPCVSGDMPPTPAERAAERKSMERKRKLDDAMTRLACDRCRELEARSGEVPEWAVEWWKIHKKEDERRIQKEVAARKSAEVRKQAIAKLSKEEREELGV